MLSQKVIKNYTKSVDKTTRIAYIEIVDTTHMKKYRKEEPWNIKLIQRKLEGS